MMWSLAHAANDPKEFELMVTSLEILLMGALLSDLHLPAYLARDTMGFLLTDLRMKPQGPGPRKPALTPPLAGVSASGNLASPATTCISGGEQEGSLEPLDFLRNSSLRVAATGDSLAALDLHLPQKEPAGRDDWAKDMDEQAARQRSGSTTTDPDSEG
jgi:hypothetical protein